MHARKRLTQSLQALLVHLDMGLIQDTALPGTSGAEATRLLKNGVSVSAFACYEHFIRERIFELLQLIVGSPELPDFDGLPEGLQLASTRGVIDALRFRLTVRADGLTTSDIVDIAQHHSSLIASTGSGGYKFSEWSFGHSTSNVSAGTLSDFLAAIDAARLFTQLRDVLQEIRFDYAAAGLVEGSKFKIGRISAWRHEAAHDATLSIDVELLRTRITAYLAVAFAFDYLASFGARVLIDSFSDYGQADLDRTYAPIFQLIPVLDQFDMQTLDGRQVERFYSVAHCEDKVSARATPLSGATLVRDTQQRIVDWLFY